MKVVLLAAGRGTRISRNIGEISKCMVDVAGQPLIVHTVEMLKRRGGGTDINIVVGYRKEAIIRAFENDPCVRIAENPFYSVTNSIGSLWFLRDVFDGSDDVIIANGDTFWEDSLFDFLMEDKRDIVMLSDASRADTGDYFFMIQQGLIKKYGKDLLREERNAEYVGIAKMDRNMAVVFRERMLQFIEEQKINCWWEDVLYSFVNERSIYAKDVEGRFWAEVDYLDDYERILSYEKKRGKNA